MDQPTPAQLRAVATMLTLARPRMIEALRRQYGQGPRALNDTDFAVESMRVVSQWLLERAEKEEQ